MIYEELLEQEWRMRVVDPSKFRRRHHRKTFGILLRNMSDATVLLSTSGRGHMPGVDGAGSWTRKDDSFCVSAFCTPPSSSGSWQEITCNVWFILCCVDAADSKAQTVLFRKSDHSTHSSKTRGNVANRQNTRLSCPLRFSRKLFIFREENPDLRTSNKIRNQKHFWFRGNC